MLCLLLSLWLQPAHALENITHSGKIDVQIVLSDDKGKSDRLEAMKGRLSLSWDSRECEWVTQDARYPCKLDLSQDLVDANGEILIKALPKVHFEQKALDQLLLATGAADKKSVNLIDRAMKESASTRASGFDVPWYTVRDDFSAKSNEPPQFWSAFAGLYLDLPVPAPNSLGAGRSMSLRFHFYDLEARRGAFDIIGNNSAGNFGN